mmetsp:Transcript_12621/g.20484  ORF Transcript_12621/g.20484 Transcript_12621/m.20484 type:complete len:1127 (+) Transcript_12621:89-3469(+)
MSSIATTTHIVSDKPPKFLKEGILYKQRNHFKGWRSRWFALDNQFLHYYLEKEDMASRNSIQIESGTIVVIETNVKVSHDIAYYPFLISHPNSSMVYRLSTTSKEDRDSWVSALNSLISGTAQPDTEKEKQASSYVYAPSGSIDAGVDDVTPPIANVEEDDDSYAMENPEGTLSHIPLHCRDQVEATVRKLMEAAASDDPAHWTFMFNKKGVLGYSQVTAPGSSSSAVCVKGVCMMPFTIPEIYNVVANGERRTDLDSQLAKYHRLHWFSRHTGVEHLQFKAVWPTTARDFCNLTHWRLLKSGTFVTLGMSEKFLDLCPEQSSFVRARLIGGGYVFKPVQGGTLVTIVVQSDLGGTLPASICNLAAQSQPYVLYTLRTLLEKSLTRSPLPLDAVPPAATYDELLNCAKRYQKGTVDSERVSRSSSADLAVPTSPTPERLTQRDFVEACGTSPTSSPVKRKKSGSNDEHEPLLPEEMRAHIPDKYTTKVERLVQNLLKDALTTDSREWAPLSDKKDIKAHTKVNGPSGAAFYVKGETFLPYSIPEIFSVYFESTNRPKLDSQMATYSRLRWITRHAGVEYMQFKGQWPTTPRDSCNFTHWRLLNNGTLVDLGFTDNTQPEDSSFVRAELQMGGYVFIPAPGGTRAVIVVHTSLGGSLPNSICQMASAHQPSTMHKLRTLLNEKYKNSSSRPNLDVPKSPREVYDELLSIARKYQGKAVDFLGVSEKSPDALSESGDSAKSSRTSSAPPMVPIEPETPRLRAALKVDPLGLTLLVLPFVDCLYYAFGGHSVMTKLMNVSVVLAIYLLVMFYDKLIAWILRKHLGFVCNGSALRTGAEVYRFNVDMGRVEEFLTEQQMRVGSGVSLTAVHVVVKAVGVALDEMRHMHGVLLDDSLYRAPRSSVDVSFSESSGAGDHNGILLHHVHDVSSPAATITSIAREASGEKQQHGANYSAVRLFLRAIRPFVPTFVADQLLVYMNDALVAFFITLGVDVQPFGAARVISVLAKDEGAGNETTRNSITATSPLNNGDMKEDEIDFSVLPMMSNVAPARRGVCLPSVTVTLGYGGVKFVPVQHQEKKIVRKFRVINVAVSLHEVLTSSPGCTLQERQEFIAKLKSLLNNPKTLYPSN